MKKQNSTKSSDPELDILLSQWAERHALPALKADSIRAAALSDNLSLAHPSLIAHTPATAQTMAPSAELPYQWWERFYSDLTAAFQQPISQQRHDQAVLKSLLYSSSLSLPPTAHSNLAPA